MQASPLSHSLATPPLWPEDAKAVAALLDSARQEHLVPLLTYRLKSSPLWDTLPAVLHIELNHAYRQAASYQMLRMADLRELLAWLRQQGVEPLVLKGAAWAYTHYPDPATRPAADVDLLLPPTCRAPIEAGLIAQGFSRNLTLGDTPLSTQRTYYRRDAHGQPHAYDLHWSLSNSPFISAQFRYAELFNRAQWVAELEAYTLAPADALIYACLHWTQHQSRAEQRLIWLYDLGLLAGKMTIAEAQTCIAQMRVKQLQTPCQQVLTQALALFPTQLATPLTVWLDTALPHEPSAALLASSRLARMRLDWQALGTAQARFDWLRAHLFPSAEYMQARYPGIAPWYAYLQRLAQHRALR